MVRLIADQTNDSNYNVSIESLFDPVLIVEWEIKSEKVGACCHELLLLGGIDPLFGLMISSSCVVERNAYA